MSEESFSDTAVIDGLLEELVEYQDALTQALKMDKGHLPKSHLWECCIRGGKAYLDRVPQPIED